MEKITISKKEYDELKAKATKLDRIMANSVNNLPNAKRTPEERSVAARRAVQARWVKKSGNK